MCVLELILTERRHVRTVKVMMLVSWFAVYVYFDQSHSVVLCQLFGRGMIRRARLQAEAVDEMMPGIEGLDRISSRMAFCVLLL